MTTATASRLRDLIARELDELIEIRHDLHAHPELRYEEHRTSEIVQRELKNARIEFVNGLAGGTGVLAHLPAEGDRATGLRADMDALPIEEKTDLSYMSTHPGRMHACGHDGHTTMLIGAARVLAKIAVDSALPRPITLCFQPAEEGGSGGKRMVEDGCLDGSVIGAPIGNMFGLHGWPEMKVGNVGTRIGPMLAAADKFTITITGQGAHAAYPHQGNDTIVAGAAIVSALQTICSRNVKPLDSIVVSVTQFHGGTSHNILPQEIFLHGTVRTLLPETQALAIRRLTDIAEKIAAAHECAAHVEYEKVYPVTRNAPEAVNIFNSVATEAFGSDRIMPLAEPVMGGEDFSFYCNEVPSCFFALGLLPQDRDSMPQLHNPSFNFNDDALAVGIEMFCRLALRD